MYHNRKKSGHGSANTSMTDVRKASSTATDSSKHKSRPAMARRSTPQSSNKPSKSPRERERERQESWDDDEDSFPQYCMTCEKQFVTNDDRCLYCSEACRKHDQESYPSKHAYKASHRQYGSYSLYPPEPRDIIPRASPSRPNSTHYSAPITPEAASYHTSAVSALRSLNIGPPSPPSPNWFSRSAATSPGTSYKRGASSFFSSTYDGGYENAATYGYKYSSSGMDRPLPSRRPEVSSRPKSIELVTPMVGR